MLNVDGNLPGSRGTQRMATVFDHAHRLTAQAASSTALQGQRELGEDRAESSRQPSVRNTFNVQVAVGQKAGLEAQPLEDALMDILRAAARRHGLEL